MPDCNIRNVDNSLMTAVKVEAARSGLTLRDFVIKSLAQAVGWEAKSLGLGGVASAKEETSVDREPTLQGTAEHLPESESRPDRKSPPGNYHNRKTCRLYGCLMCEAEKA